MSRQTRRTFLKQSTAAGIATSFTIAGTKSSGKVIGSNDTIRVGVARVKFIVRPDAEALLTHPYRKPYVLPSESVL
jgi:hypothetical protein